jgi:hypothetical protein
MAAGILASHAFAQSDPRFIPIASGSAKGALYSPDSGPDPHVGILIVHRTGDYMNYHACRALSARGYLTLCMNTRAENNPASVVWEDLALDLGAGVRFLRDQPGITSVLLWGWSGGLPPADGLVLVDTNHGIAHQAIARLNPTLQNDAEIFGSNQPPRIDPSLDPFDPLNGYNADGASKYSEEFKARYFAPQSRRMNELIELAEAAQRKIREGSAPYSDDDVFVVLL